MNPNQRFAELAGICLHDEGVVFDGRYRCCKCADTVDCDYPSPDFTDAREVLKVMMARKLDFWSFGESLGGLSNKDGYVCIPAYLVIDTTGKLRDLAIQWMENRP
jgi:hypothetical protein